MMNLTYEIKENGYEIYDNGKLWITQYEPYIPNKNLSYEENAIADIEELIKPKETQENRKITELEVKMGSLEEENANLILDSIEKEIRLAQAELDFANLLLLLGGM